MRNSFGLFVGLMTLILATESTAQPLHFWSQKFGGVNDDIGNGVAVDGAGNVFVTGVFQGAVDFGGGSVTSAGEETFLAKYSSTGAHQWSWRAGSGIDDAGKALAVDMSGNIIVTGSFQGILNFPVASPNLVSAGADDIFVAKFSPTGIHQWSQRFGSTNSDTGYSVAVDGSGNVILTGSFQGTVNFGGSNLVSAGLEDIFVAKYNSSGVHQWSKRFGSTSSDNGYRVAVDNVGNVLVIGSFQGTVNFGGANLGSAGLEDIFLAKYDLSGAHQWSQRFGSTGFDVGIFLAADNVGNVIATGEFENTVNFGGGGLVSAGDRDVFIAKYNSSGTHQWSKRFGSTGIDLGAPVAIDAMGSVIASGSVEETVDFGGGNLTSSGAHDIFIAKYNSSGIHQWSQMFGSASDEFGLQIAEDATGRVVSSGVLSNSSKVSFGGGTLTSVGGFDTYLAMFGSTSPTPLITSISDIGNDQGRQVKIRFIRSGFDDKAASSPIERYEAYRRDDTAPSLIAGGLNLQELTARQLRTVGWTQVGAVAAHNQASYGIDVPTIGDSTAALGQYHSVFFVRAAKNAPSEFFDSPADSGYSIDNLAPGIPNNFAFSSNVLTWNQSTAIDFDYFSIYGSNTNSFASATIIDYTVTPSLDVSSSPYVTILRLPQISRGTGKPTVVNTLSSVGGTPRSYIFSLSAYPNPFNPATTMRYTLPSPGRVTISIYDLHGARVATLLDRELEPGAYTIEWDGRDQAGQPAGSGVYFGRLTSSSGTRSYKLTLVK